SLQGIWVLESRVAPTSITPAATAPRDSAKPDFLRNTIPHRINWSAALVARSEGSVAGERPLDRRPAKASGAGHDGRRRSPAAAAGTHRRRPDGPRPAFPARQLRPPGTVRADRRRRPAALRQDLPEPGPLLGQGRWRAGAHPGGVLRPHVGLDARRPVRPAAQ